MSTLNDVQDAMVTVIAQALYPNGYSSPSIFGSQIQSITVTNGGIDYTTAIITITDSTGQSATAIPVISGGVITSILLTNKGYNYTSPTISISGDGSNAAATAILSQINIPVYAGDPLKNDLDTDLRAGNVVHIAVFATRGMTRDSTRLRRDYIGDVLDTPTFILDVSSNTVTITGSVTVGQACMILVDGTGYSYAALSTDTLDTIASALSALIPGASALNNVITIPGNPDIIGRVSVAGKSRRILHSFESLMRARIIAPSNLLRDVIGSAIQIAFATLGDKSGYVDYYLPMPDLVSASIKPNAVTEVNTYELDLAFVRDYLYLVEYHVVQTAQYQSIADAETISDID